MKQKLALKDEKTQNLRKWMENLIIEVVTKKLNSVAFSPQANYTERATAACRRSW
jgi:hypothetical protein